MVYELFISTAVSNGELPAKLSERFYWLEEKGYSFILEEQYRNAEQVSFRVRLVGSNPELPFRDEDMIYIFKHQLAEFMAEHVVYDWEPLLVWKEICKKSRQLSPGDRPVVYEKASSFLKNCNQNESLNLLMNYGRKNRIAHKIMDYLYSNNILFIEGFIQFCMREYLNEIRFAVDLACEELKSEKEYNEFVQLLRYFVDTQPSYIIEVNLFIDKQGNYILWDEDGKRLDDDLINYYLEDLLVPDITLDDILISILITIAPRRIILHRTGDEILNESVKMIQQVFAERIQECRGCKHCKGLLRDLQSGPYSFEP
ncbi:MAG TPA: hypothetical protein GX404_09095 [Syntrophomonadaceae bacterium]|nr:hypothetical protein [Syntrophomonadaceae bacterium]